MRHVVSLVGVFNDPVCKTMEAVSSRWYPRTSDIIYVHSRALRHLGHVFRMDADRTPSLLQCCWVVDGEQPSGKTKDLYDSAVQKLLDELGLSPVTQPP
jgi:hypothetical protein